jgi:hypothetical protein
MKNRDLRGTVAGHSQQLVLDSRVRKPLKHLVRKRRNAISGRRIVASTSSPRTSSSALFLSPLSRSPSTGRKYLS